MDPNIQISSTRLLKESLIQEAAEHQIKIDQKVVLQIKHHQSKALAETLNLSPEPWVITSVEALKTLLQLQEKQHFDFTHHEAYCIEGRTSEMAKQMGFRVLASENSSEELAHTIYKNGAPKKLIHLGSNRNMKPWKTFLLERGTETQTLQVYYKIPEPKVFSVKEGIMFFSPSQIDVFFMNNALPHNIPAFCIGKTTATALIDYGHTHNIIPKDSNAESLLHSIYKYFNKI